MDAISGIGFIAIALLLLVGIYAWLFGASKYSENDGRV